MGGIVGSIAGGLIGSALPGVGTSIGSSIGGALGGAISGSDAASSAAGAQTSAANAATQAQLQMFNTTQANLKPYMTSGTTNLDNLNAMLTSGKLGGQFTNADLNANLAPNYAFQLQQGQQALQNSQAAGNGALSGAALKDMQNFVQGTAAGAYQNAYNNWLSTQNLDYNQLYNMSSLGQNAAAGVGNAAIQTGANIGANMIGAGNAQAAGIIAGQNAMNQGVSNANGYGLLNSMMGGSNPLSSLSGIFGGGAGPTLSATGMGLDGGVSLGGTAADAGSGAIDGFMSGLGF